MVEKGSEFGRREWPTWLRVALLLGLLYLFFVGLELMGVAFKSFGKEFAERLIETTSNPFVGLVIGLLSTSLVQSSSTTTSMIVAMVGAGALDVAGAVPIIMGANIGTSVTNTLVSLAHVGRPEEFRRAFSGATVHDFFNWLAVLILLPLEIAFGYLSHLAEYMEEVLESFGGIHLLNPLSIVVKPVAGWFSTMLAGAGILILILGVVFILVSLRFLVSLLRQVMSGRAEQMLHRTLFRSAPAAILAGVVITVMVQSSSITTSVMVPLMGAGVITLEQAFPFTVGANIGTTITAILASLAVGTPAAVTVALTHLMFNVTGAGIIYGIPPIRRIPLWLARSIGNLAVRRKTLAISYILMAFYGIPLLLLFLSGALDARQGPVPSDGTLRGRSATIVSARVKEAETHVQ